MPFKNALSPKTNTRRRCNAMKVSSFLAVLTLGAVAGVMMSEFSPEIKKMLKKGKQQLGGN